MRLEVDQARSALATTRKHPNSSMEASCRSSNGRIKAMKKRAWPSCSRGQRMLKEEVDEEDIAEVVSEVDAAFR